MIDDESSVKWGAIDKTGAEIWDTSPVFLGDKVTAKDWIKLFFYPKKFFLYHYIKKARRSCHNRTTPRAGQKIKKFKDKTFRILDVGCGTGASVIDMKKMFGRSVEVYGIDVVRLQVELAKEKIKKYGVWAEFSCYEGIWTEFELGYFDAIYTSDVLGHVESVDKWLKELNRILKPGGVLAMFSESKLGRHAYIRNYLLKHGLNVDPHAQFHISLYSKQELKNKIEQAGFEIEKMYTAFWAGFFVHPDEFYHQMKSRKDFKFLRLVNSILYFIKKKTHPFSTAVAELYGLVEMVLLGRWVEAQGYVVLAKKRENSKT